MTILLLSVITGSQCSDGEVRLTGGGSGIVEICIRGYWGTLCSYYTETDVQMEASAICNWLGYSSIGVSKVGSGTCGINNSLLSRNINTYYSSHTDSAPSFIYESDSSFHEDSIPLEVSCYDPESPYCYTDVLYDDCSPIGINCSGIGMAMLFGSWNWYSIL